MRLGRLAAAGLLGGAVVAFAIALLMPRRHPLLEAPTDTMDAPDPGDGTEPARSTQQVDVAAAERAHRAATRAMTR